MLVPGSGSVHRLMGYLALAKKTFNVYPRKSAILIIYHQSQWYRECSGHFTSVTKFVLLSLLYTFATRVSFVNCVLANLPLLEFCPR